MKALTWHGKRDASGPDGVMDANLPLEHAPRAYEIFQKKEDRAIEVVLKP